MSRIAMSQRLYLQSIYLPLTSLLMLVVTICLVSLMMCISALWRAKLMEQEEPYLDHLYTTSLPSFFLELCKVTPKRILIELW